METRTKVCRICHIEKPWTEFTSNRTNPTPKQQKGYCRTCRQYVRNKIQPSVQECGACHEVLSHYEFDLDNLGKGVYQLGKLCRTCAADHRVCARCHEVQPVEEFQTKAKGGVYRDNVCRLCRKEEELGVRFKQCPACHRSLTIASFYRNEPVCGMCRDDYKVCTDCGEVKPISDFPMNKVDGRTIPRSICRVCTNRAGADAYHADVEGSRAARRRSSKRAYWENPEKYRQKAILDVNKRRGKFKGLRNDLSVADREFLLGLADNKCLACGGEFDQSSRRTRLNWDHVHNGAEGVLDGLTIRNAQPLCGSCNSAKNSTQSTNYRPQWMLDQIYQYILANKDYPQEELEFTYQLLYA